MESGFDPRHDRLSTRHSRRETPSDLVKVDSGHVESVYHREMSFNIDFGRIWSVGIVVHL
jgi:hypothetical protein